MALTRSTARDFRTDYVIQRVIEVLDREGHSRLGTSTGPFGGTGEHYAVAYITVG